MGRQSIKSQRKASQAILQRYRRIVEWRKAGQSFEAIGKRLCISRQRVFQLYWRMIKRGN